MSNELRCPDCELTLHEGYCRMCGKLHPEYRAAKLESELAAVREELAQANENLGAEIEYRKKEAELKREVSAELARYTEVNLKRFAEIESQLAQVQWVVRSKLAQSEEARKREKADAYERGGQDVLATFGGVVSANQLIKERDQWRTVAHELAELMERLPDAGASAVHLPEFPADDPGGCDGCKEGWCQSAVDAIVEGREQYRRRLIAETALALAHHRALVKAVAAEPQTNKEQK